MSLAAFDPMIFRLDTAELRATRLLVEDGMPYPDICRALRITGRTLYRRLEKIRALRERHEGDDAPGPDA